MPREDLAKALTEFAKAAAKVEAAWPEGVPDVPGYPFTKSFDEVAWDIASWASIVRARGGTP